ncbi:hypothetical protein HZS_5398 [Henneguya salminicola]|nr:hypothetical protein HZS_5398 [Henneguya salminicola]
MKHQKHNNIKKSDQIKLEKSEIALLQKLRKCCPVKKALLKKQKMEYFKGSDVFDCLKNINPSCNEKENTMILTKLMNHGNFIPVEREKKEYKIKDEHDEDHEKQKKRVFLLSRKSLLLRSLQLICMNFQYLKTKF